MNDDDDVKKDEFGVNHVSIYKPSVFNKKEIFELIFSYAHKNKFHVINGEEILDYCNNEDNTSIALEENRDIDNNDTMTNIKTEENTLITSISNSIHSDGINVDKKKDLLVYVTSKFYIIGFKCSRQRNSHY